MTYISKHKQSFGSVAKDYKKYRGSYNAELYKLIFSLAKKNELISILDLGCGVGNSTEPLVEMARKLKIKVSVTGCDPDEDMLAEARKGARKNKLPITYIQGSAEKLPFEGESFDLVISGAAFHWFATQKAMKEIKRVLINNGMYFVFWQQNVKSKTPAIGAELYKKYKWQGIPQKLRDPKYVKDIFMKGGFKNVKTIKIPYIEQKTISEAIGLIKTNSTYALLSPNDKKIFIREMTNAYKKVLGNKKQTLNQEIHICYGAR